MREQTLLKGFVDTYESAVKERQAYLNRMRCWFRDTLPQEQWEDMDFSDKALLKSDIISKLPVNLQDAVNHAIMYEKFFQKLSQEEVKNHPLYPWLESVRGIGGNIAMKLLSALGDIDRFPTVSHFWSYCGMDGEGWRKRPHNWTITQVCYLIADSFQYQRKGSGGYREIYDNRKEYEQTKPPCEKCLESGNTESCRPAHINNRARRYAVKMFLKDLWIANKELNQGQGVVSDNTTLVG